MLQQFLFWCALLLAVMGMNSPDGNLYFFLAVHLIGLATGRFLHRRDKHSRGDSTAGEVATGPTSISPKKTPAS